MFGEQYALLLTMTDGITIAGVENSRPIEPPEPTAASLQLTSLASIVDSLLLKDGASHPWSSMLRELPSKLRERPIEELIKVRPSRRDPEMHSFRLPLSPHFFLRNYASTHSNPHCPSTPGFLALLLH